MGRRLIPTMTPDLAAQAPNPEYAWILQPKKETEPLYTEDMRINLKNYAINVEYQILAMRMCSAGYPIPIDVRLAWEREMIQKYDPYAAEILGLTQGARSAG